MSSMLNPKVETILNQQIAIEAQADYKYLALAAWCDMKGFAGAAKFLYEHADEERMHMMKMIGYVMDKGGTVAIPAIEQPLMEFSDIREVIRYAYEGEQFVTASIYKIVSLTQELQDHTTNNFIQWYVTEQLEEENLYRSIMDRIELIGEGGNSLYLIDVEIEKLCKGAGGMAVVNEAH